MKKKSKIIKNAIIFILLIILTFYIILKDQNLGEMFQILGTVKLQYILIAVLCMCIYVLGESINIGRTLKALNEKTTFFQNIKYALIGFFFSGITPAASGGQPMQIYYMYKDKISVANSTLSLLINLSSMQVVTISLALISVVVNHSIMNTALICFFVIGILLNASALTLLIIAIFHKKLLQKLINFVVKIMKKIKIKNVDKKQEKIENELNKYQASSDYIKEHKLVMLKTIFTTYIQFLAYYSVSYWVYRSFGLNEYNILKIISIQSVLYGTVSGIPSPGAVGVTEGGFIEIFKTVFPKNSINGAMILNRGINFYLLIVISAVITMTNAIKFQKMEEKNTENNEEIS